MISYLCQVRGSQRGAREPPGAAQRRPGPDHATLAIVPHSFSKMLSGCVRVPRGAAVSLQLSWPRMRGARLTGERLAGISGVLGSPEWSYSQGQQTGATEMRMGLLPSTPLGPVGGWGEGRAGDPQSRQSSPRGVDSSCPPAELPRPAMVSGQEEACIWRGLLGGGIREEGVGRRVTVCAARRKT